MNDTEYPRQSEGLLLPGGFTSVHVLKLENKSGKSQVKADV